MNSDIPVACTLDAAQAADQLGSWAALRPHRVRAERTAGRATAWFEPAAETELRAVAEREAACCRFLDFSVEPDGDLIRLDISSSAPGAEAVIDVLIGQ